jgi:error-prone DNA polymerase
VQSSRGVVHLVVERVIDHSDMLRRIGGVDEAFTVATGRGDEASHASSDDAPEKGDFARFGTSSFRTCI